jgi:hypothetical protein
MAVSTRLRWEILRRDQFACRYCGARALEDGAVLEVDHVLPKVLGGRDRADNLVAACEACNSGKGSTHPDSPLIEDVEADALRWARVIKRAGQKVMADQAALEDLLSEFEEAWERWGYGEGDERQTIPKASDWERRITRLLVGGLPMPLLLECIPPAMAEQRRSHEVRFLDMCELAQAKLNQLCRTADRVVRDGQSEPDFAALSVPAFAESLLEYLTDDEREAALDKTREDYDEDVELLTAHTVFSNLVTDRLSLLNALERLLGFYPQDEVAEAKRQGSEDLIEFVGVASEAEVAASGALAVATYRDALSFLDRLPEIERDAWLDYVRAWPHGQHGERAIAIQAADVAKRASQGQSNCLRGMCGVPAKDSPIKRCALPITHSVWVDACVGCIESGLADCDGNHPVCEEHLASLINDEIVRASTGESVTIRDFAELAVSV